MSNEAKNTSNKQAGRFIENKRLLAVSKEYPDQTNTPVTPISVRTQESYIPDALSIQPDDGIVDAKQGTNAVALCMFSKTLDLHLEIVEGHFYVVVDPDWGKGWAYGRTRSGSQHGIYPATFMSYV